MEDVLVQRIEETYVAGKKLGRHVEHDPRSKEYPWEVTHAKITNVKHTRNGPVFNQGRVGSCTGNAAAGACNTEPFYSVHKHSLFTESDAVSIYTAATRLDDIPGSYPPNDTGSSGLAVAKVLQSRSLIASYQHAFDIHAALDALMNQAIIVGVPWYEGFDSPDENGLVKLEGEVRGGHEIMARQYALVGKRASKHDLVWFDNSWGATFGLVGRFAMEVATLEELLAQQGDVTILVA
jgi:hypothetical protein